MFTGPTIAGLVLFVYYAVTFTKEPFNSIKDPQTQNWAVRLWALVLGIVGAIVDGHFGNGLSWSGPPMYDAVKAGASAAIASIVTWHIGQPGFLGAFDTETTALNAAIKADAKPAVVTSVTKTVVAETPAPQPERAALTPAQKAGMVDLGTVGLPPVVPNAVQPPVPVAAP